MERQIKLRYLPHIMLLVLFLLFPLKTSAAPVNSKNIKLAVGAEKTLKLNDRKVSGIKWKSNNKKIATVSKNGKVKAKRRGKTSVTATYKNKKYVYNITVVKLSLNKKTCDLYVGKKIQLKIKGKTAGMSAKWNSDNPSVAKVSKSGKVTAIKAGNATISAKCAGKKMTCKVYVDNKDTAGQTAGYKLKSNKDEIISESEDVVSPYPADNQENKNDNNNGAYNESYVRNILLSFKNKYPNGMIFTNSRYYPWNGGIYRGGYGCAAFAFELSDAVFHEKPATMIKTNFLQQIRTGDIILFKEAGGTHIVIVLKVYNEYIVVAEANYDDKVKWGRKIYNKELKSTASALITRY